MDTRSKMIENDEDESDENNKNVENAKLMENAIDGGGEGIILTMVIIDMIMS